MVSVKTIDVCASGADQSAAHQSSIKLEDISWLDDIFEAPSANRADIAASIQYEHPYERKIEKVPSPHLQFLDSSTNDSAQSLRLTGFLASESLDSVPNYYPNNAEHFAKEGSKKYCLAKRLPGSPEPLQFYLDPKLESKIQAKDDVHCHRQELHCAKQSLPFWPELVKAIATITKSHQDFQEHAPLATNDNGRALVIGTGSILARALQTAYRPAKIGNTVDTLSQFLSDKENGFVCLEIPGDIHKGDFILGYDSQDKPKQAAICFEADTVLHDANGKPERKDMHLFAANPQFAKLKVFRFVGA